MTLFSPTISGFSVGAFLLEAFSTKFNILDTVESENSLFTLIFNQ